MVGGYRWDFLGFGDKGRGLTGVGRCGDGEIFWVFLGDPNDGLESGRKERAGHWAGEQGEGQIGREEEEGKGNQSCSTQRGRTSLSYFTALWIDLTDLFVRRSRSRLEQIHCIR